MSGYVAPLEDMRFVLTELAGLSGVLAARADGDLQEDTVDAVLAEAAKFASGVLAPTNAVGDREGLQLVDGRVRMPTGFRDAYARFVEAGWGAIGAPVEYGGQALPRLVTTAVAEMWKSANLAFSANFLLTAGAVEAIATHGSKVQRERYLPRMVSGEWCGAMNLTEPHAGSDLATIRTRAVPQADGSYRIFGQKCFITFGDHDLAENIVHLVLARLPDAPPGSKGISLFLVPRCLVKEDGSLGERNDVKVSALEKKLGQHASPTCVVLHGDDGAGAYGELVGEAGAGLAYIFVMVNAARMSISLEGLAIAERAFQHADAYASARIQGRIDGEPVLIARHPDVQRMLLTMRAQTEAMRAAAYVVASWLDLAKIHPDEETRRDRRALVDLLIPVLKGWTSETGVDIASIGIQIHGGAGYVEEAGAAQYLRDVRASPIYEGTTGIQGSDLVARKIARKPGRGTLSRLLIEMESIVSELATAAGNEHIDAIAISYRTTLASVFDATEVLLKHIDEDMPAALSVSVPYLKMLGVALGGWQLARSAVAVHRRALEAGNLDAFGESKLLTARHYAEHVLPTAIGLGFTVQHGARRTPR